MSFPGTSVRSSNLFKPASALRSLWYFTGYRSFTTTKMTEENFKPAKRVAGQRQDVWSIINEAAAATPKQPVVNMGQGFL